MSVLAPTGRFERVSLVIPSARQVVLKDESLCPSPGENPKESHV